MITTLFAQLSPDGDCSSLLPCGNPVSKVQSVRATKVPRLATNVLKFQLVKQTCVLICIIIYIYMYTNYIYMHYIHICHHLSICHTCSSRWSPWSLGRSLEEHQEAQVRMIEESGVIIVQQLPKKLEKHQQKVHPANKNQVPRTEI